MTEETFDDVLVAAQGGDELAFAHLWRSVNPRLVGYLRTVTPATAADVASETWIQVIRNLSKFAGDELAFRGWIFTIARNKLTDAQRRDRRRPRTTGDTTLDTMAAPDDTALRAIENMTTDSALALIAVLPHDQAEVILLRVVAGLDVATVARILGKTPGAVRINGHRGLRRLQQLVGRPPVSL